MLHEELFEVLIPLTDSPGLVSYDASTFFKNHFANFGRPAIETFQHHRHIVAMKMANQNQMKRVGSTMFVVVGNDFAGLFFWQHSSGGG